MASPKSILTIAIGRLGKDEPEKGEECCAINELIERVFTTRNLVHFAHLLTKSYASHMALGDLYDGIIDEVDDIAEVYIGEFGELKDLECNGAKVPNDIIKHLDDEFNWIKVNRSRIANNSSVIENMLDTLSAKYSKALYKLKNLH